MSCVALGVLSSMVAGCGADACEQLCDNTRTQIRNCLSEWPVGWEEFDAESAADFRTQCRDEWAAARADLEPRQLDDALDQCQESLALLVALQDDGLSCEELRAMLLVE